MSKKIEKKPQRFNDVNDLPLSKENYLLMLAGFAVVIIGFITMSGGTDDIYSARKITIAPIILMIGFLFVIYGIMKKPKSNTAE
jgi:hypothetical protein